jgi:phosphatidylinositol-3-phosphatase
MPGARGAAGPALVAAAATLLLAAALAGCGGDAHPGAPLAVGPVHALPAAARSHVIVLVMENKEDRDVLGSSAAPALNALARGGGVATRSYGVRHPSLPNYLALTSGSTHGIADDCTDCHVDARSIADQLEAAGLTWKAYLEDLPAPCSTAASAGGYAKKHNPFAYYDAIVRDPARCRRMVGFGQLARDLRADRLPGFSFIVPNLCNDTHDCGVAQGDRFLARTVPPLRRQLGPHGFLVLTYDEGDSDAGCCGVAHGGRIATVVLGPDVRPGTRDARPVDHYGVLATIERAFGLGRLGAAADPRNGTLAGLFRGGRVPSLVRRR